MTNIIEVERASDTEKPKTERAVVTEVETRDGCFEGNDNLKVTTAAYAVESAQLDGVSARDTGNVRKDVEGSDEKGELSVVDVETFPGSTIKYQVDKEVVHVNSSDTNSPSQGSVAVETNQSRDPSLTTPKIPIEHEYVDNFLNTEPVVSAPERSVDLNSQTDSLEANWGSISGSPLPSISTGHLLMLVNL
ncbi:hypothetical protein MLD38_010973 [Melastoma candidum]|uniref:Uncharacterized protein n=1 Tax=Melastoma candidum TaxID=119954 RepID=A0ACB9R2W5_9MYRT|nr:hypothetical protein MLD38_010973 [Melastoma candidum]